MTILLRSEGPPCERDVLVFGSGAIGRAVVSRLRHRRPFSPLTFSVPWTVPTSRVEALRCIKTALEQRAAQRPVSVVWAAGRAGFSAADSQAEHEFAAYKDVVDLVEQMPRHASSQPPAFHLVSSAGGLYEGRFVRSASEPPTPIRTYGRLKLAQEEHALGTLPRGTVAIYRPSSVYTAPGHGQRLGLVGALVQNGLAHRTTTISGALDTLRDYVMASDVGAYVADRGLEGVDAVANPHLLVSGHPASVLQVIAGVEWVVRRRLYIQMAESWNAQNITFSAAARAAKFQATQLKTGIRLVYAAALGRSATA